MGAFGLFGVELYRRFGVSLFLHSYTRFSIKNLDQAIEIKVLISHKILVILVLKVS